MTRSRELCLILLCYAAAHFIWRSGVLIPFSANGFIEQSHFLDPIWLRDDLLKSLWYLHSQPPLMNLLAGLVFKAGITDYADASEWIHAVASVAGLAWLFGALVRFDVARAVRLPVCIAVAVLPSFYFYELWARSTHLEFCLCAGMLYYLAGFYTRDHRRASLAKLFVLCAVLGLMRPQWHLVIFLGFAALLWWPEGKAIRRQITLLSLIFILPLSAWYGKNYLLYGFFGPSSWLGGNISEVSIQVSTPDERWQLRESGTIAPDFPGDFDMEKIIRRVPPETVSIVHPSLGAFKASNPEVKNLNYIGIIESCRIDQHDALVIFRRKPVHYTEIIAEKIWRNAFVPSISYRSESLGYVYGVFPPSLRYLMEMATFMLTLTLPVTLLLVSLQKGSDPRVRKFILGSLGLMVMMLVTSHALNGYEQERLRWGWTPIYWCYLAIFAEMVRRELAARKSV